MQADFNEIYNLLFAGKKLQLEFQDAKAAEYFRVRFAQFKSRQENSLVDSGFLETEALSAFSFIRVKDSSIWTLSFTPKKIVATFKILVLDE